MSRNPKNVQPNRGYAGTGRIVGDEPPVEVYPLERGGKATPDRSQPPRIGAACYDTDRVPAPPAFTNELREGVEMGTSRGNNEPVPKTSQEYGDSVRGSRGVRTRPVRPGQHA